MAASAVSEEKTAHIQALHARVRQLEIQVRRRVMSTFAGTYKSAFKGAGLEFDEVRQYQYGDDVRAIDWNVTARNTHDIYVKVFREERQLTVWVLLDVSASQQFGAGASEKFATALEATALLGLAAQTNGDRFGVITFTDQIERVAKPTTRRKDLLGTLTHLIDRNFQARATNLSAALEFARRVQHRRSLVFVISDFLDTGYERALLQLGRRHELNCLRLYHPAEATLGGLGIVPVTALETGQTRWISAGASGLGSRLERAFSAHGERLEQLCTRYGLGYLALDTTAAPLDALERYFLTRKGRRRRAL